MPQLLNVLLAALVVLASLFAFALLPWVLLAESGHWAWLLIPAVLLTPTHWGLIHEGIHGHLLASRKNSDRLARLLSVLFGCPFRILRAGHLFHHQHNRTPLDRSEVIADRAGLAARAGYYARLLGGLYLGEVIAAVAVFLPRWVPLRLTAQLGRWYGDAIGTAYAEVAQQLLAPAVLREMRIDAALTMLLIGVAAYGYGATWPLLLAVLLGRGLLVSLLDNALHYGTPLDDRSGGFDTRLTPALRWLILNGNLHAAHHRHPALPWTALPQRFATEERPLQAVYVRRVLAQLAGPIREQSLR